MQVIETLEELTRTLEKERATGRQVGLVPTMGALHAGHLALVDRARSACDSVVMTIFVNPLQFDARDDLASYPRDHARDVELARRSGVDYVFLPADQEMYPGPVLTSVRVSALTEGLEGAVRPGHFEGVATVVAKLFAAVGRCRAYFGEKDYQQLLVVRRMAADLSFPVEVVGCETVRERDGVALSSRNARLTLEQRAAAPVLHRALQAGRSASTPASGRRTGRSGDGGGRGSRAARPARLRRGPRRLRPHRACDPRRRCPAVRRRSLRIHPPHRQRRSADAMSALPRPTLPKGKRCDAA